MRKHKRRQIAVWLFLHLFRLCFMRCISVAVCLLCFFTWFFYSALKCVYYYCWPLEIWLLRIIKWTNTLRARSVEWNKNGLDIAREQLKQPHEKHTKYIWCDLLLSQSPVHAWKEVNSLWKKKVQPKEMREITANAWVRIEVKINEIKWKWKKWVWIGSCGQHHNSLSPMNFFLTILRQAESVGTSV